ncbi:unnamed protein product [Coregonus sp. 'balchen']|nr:unnamed protein product [Coregonus sp. 'balchen']
MTHAQQKDSLSRYHPGDSWEQVGGLPHAEAMVGVGRPDCPKLKRGRPKKIKRGRAKERKDQRVVEKKEEEKDRKLYPLRARTLDLCEGDTLDCRVLLTRLEESSDEDKASCLKGRIETKEEGSRNLVRGRTKPCNSRQNTFKAYRQLQEPNKQSKVLCTLPVVEPRKRRMASLNAEAVNSLLLYREYRQRTRLTNNLAKDLVILGHNTPRGPKVAKSDIYVTGSSKQNKKSMKMEDVDLLSLYGPTPRRQASLNATALLKITSTSFKAKHRVAKTNCMQLSAVLRTKQSLHPKLKKQQHHKLQHWQSQTQPQLVQRCCNLYKRESFHPEPQWEGITGGNGSIRSGFQCRALLGYPMKSVKEEQVDTQVTPSFYCCSQERSVEYCHRLAQFLNQKSFDDDKLEDRSLSKCYLPSPRSLAHPHALTIGPHHYPCYSGYYVHVAHHETPSTHMTSVSSSPMPYPPSSVAPITLCPGEVQNPKLLSPTDSHPSGIAHPVYCYGEPCQIMSSLAGLPDEVCKEEQVRYPGDSFFYCCSQERSVEYCTPVAQFLNQKSFDDDKLRIVRSPSATSPLPFPGPPTCPNHSPHHYPCYSGYYVHVAHHETPSTHMTSVSSSPMPLPALLCGPHNVNPTLSPTDSHHSGIAHPVYCYGEPCQISGYAYRAVPTLASKRCYYSSSLEDHSSSSVPASPAPRTLSGCPASPSTPPAAQSVACFQTSLSNPRQPQVPLQVARECPQSAKPPSGSLSGVSDDSPSVCPHIQDKQQLGPAGRAASRAAKQQRITRRRATNGWLPGEETTVLRKCFEGVKRDGEVIRVRDTVLLRSGPRKKSLPYIAKISALWEDSESGEMMMSLFWYYRPEHTQGGRNPSTHCENEIFASRHQDQNSVACIEDKCYVLTLAQYCRMVPPCVENGTPAHRCVPTDIDPNLVFVCRHVYDFRYGRILKNLQ